MMRRIQARSNNYTVDKMLSFSHGYGFIEQRWFNPVYIYIALTSDGYVYEINSSQAILGPPIPRAGGPRGVCDLQPMMYVRGLESVKRLYHSNLRPEPANRTPTFTSKQREIE